MIASTNSQPVSCLLCHAHMPIALACLPSLLRYSQTPIAMMLHDDGSLTDADAAQLSQALPNSRIVRRAEADQRMAEELKNRPASVAFRKETCMGLKLFDSVFFTTGDTYAYVDSDIFFFRPFRDLFQFPDAQTNALFMYDAVDNCYSFRSWQYLMAPRNVKLPQRVNAGLSCIRRSHYDPDFLEWFLAHPARGGKRHHGVPEQTAWAALGMRVGMRLWNPAQIAIAQPGLEVTPDLIAAHFVGMHRHLLPQYQTQTSPNDTAPISPTTISPRRCTSAHLAYSETRRILDRLAARILPRKAHVS